MEGLTIQEVFKFLPTLAPVLTEVLKKVQENVIPEIKLPFPLGIVVKAGANALISAILAYLAGLDPVTGVAMGASASVAYGIARPKPPKA